MSDNQVQRPGLWSQMKSHIGVVRAPYVAVLVSTLILVGVATAHPGARTLLLLVGLLGVALARLDDVQRRFDHELEDEKETPTPMAPSVSGRVGGMARFVVATVLLVISVVVTLLGAKFLGGGLDVIFLTGGISALLAGSWAVSEIRRAAADRPIWGRGLIVVAMVALLGAPLGGARGPWTWVVLGGLVAGEIGIELASERIIRRTAADLVAWGVALGAILFLAGIVWLAITHVGPTYLLLVCVAVLVVALLASSDSDALAVVFAFGLLLIVATSGKGHPANLAVTPVAGTPYFLVLGDSYTSGEGGKQYITGTNTRRPDEDVKSLHENECRRAKTAWGMQLAEDPPAGVPGHVLFLACSGADTENIAENVPDGVGGPAELKRYLDEKKRLHLGDPKFVVLGVGGNDAGFSKIGAICAGPGSCADVAGQFVKPKPGGSTSAPGEPESLADSLDDLGQAYDRVATTFKGIPVIVTPYPIPITDTGGCRVVLLDLEERRFVVHFVETLDAQIKRLAAEHGFLYMDTIENSLEREHVRLCEQNAGINFIDANTKNGNLRDSLNPKSWTHNDFHPNAKGHGAMLRAAIRWFEREGPLRMPTPTARQPPDLGTFTDACVPPRTACSVDGDWAAGKTHAAYSHVIVPLLLLFAGAWLMVAASIRWTRRKNISAANIARSGWRYLRCLYRLAVTQVRARSIERRPGRRRPRRPPSGTHVRRQARRAWRPTR